MEEDIEYIQYSGQTGNVDEAEHSNGKADAFSLLK